jgi:dTDP-4-amino-4,6-dideoxygalactose transaminase
MTVSIPLAKVGHQYSGLEAEHAAAVREVLESGKFILGPWVTRLEEEIAKLSRQPHGVAVASGTDAIHLALRALGVGAGDEVLVPALTFFASASAVTHAGARPVFSDVDRRTWLMDPADLERRIGPRTRAIIAVHLYGQPAPMVEVMAIAKKHGLKVIEDASQAIGARIGDAPVGSFGDAATFSFYPTKNLGGTGDGGMVVTPSAEVADAIRRLRGHGSSPASEHAEMGYNSRLDSIDAATLLVRLPHLGKWNEARRENARFYTKGLRGVPHLTPPAERDGVHHVYHLYVVHAGEGRDALREALLAAGIGSGVYYPTPIHLVGAYRDLGHKAGDLPGAEDGAFRTLAIPVHPGLSKEERARVLEALVAWARSRPARAA